MESLLVKDIYPVKTLTVAKSQISLADADAVIAYFKAKIDAHPVAVYIGEFDHYAHTTSLPEHAIDESFKAVKIIIFCFGKELPKAELAAVRPRSIAVVEREEDFVVSFMDAPNPAAQEAMMTWTEGLLEA
jgi:hypothetical protein